jgi:pyruvate formate lyase activating enzyme
MAIDIKGVDKTDLLNYPPYTSATIFLGGCNFLCPFCHNPDLVLKYDRIPSIPEEDILHLLRSRIKWYDAVCITGGEPTLHGELPDFIKKIKELKLLVKLDTNGSNPVMLKKLLNEKMIDYVAMDIKTAIDDYDTVTQVRTNTKAIRESISTIIGSNIDYEFRTTVIPFYHKEEQFYKISNELKGAKRYVLQQFRNSLSLLNKSFAEKEVYPDARLEEFRKLLMPFFAEVIVRNI